jgi:hypothetical protein
MKSSGLFLMMFLAIAAAFAQTPQLVSFNDLLVEADTYDGKVIRVTACTVKGIEQFGIRECESKPNFSPLICLDDYEHVLTDSHVLGEAARRPLYPEPKRSPEEEHLYRRLMRSHPGTRFSVELEGEFQNSSTESFGPGCNRRLIVHRVLALAIYHPQGVPAMDTHLHESGHVDPPKQH